MDTPKRMASLRVLQQLKIHMPLLQDLGIWKTPPTTTITAIPE
jgi:hypothetical protein